MHDIKALTKAEWFRAVIDRNYPRVKASVNEFGGSRDIDGDTGLIKAVRSNDIEMVRILAPHENRSVNRDGRTALIIAVMHDLPEACSILAPYEKMVTLPDNRTALMQAAAAGSIACVRTLTDHFFQEADSQGWTALDYAVNRGHFDCVRLLCETQKPTLDNIDRCISAAETSNKENILNFLRNYRNRTLTLDLRVSHIDKDALNEISPHYSSTSTFDSNGLPLQTMYNYEEKNTSYPTTSPGAKAFDPRPNVHYGIEDPRQAATEIAMYNRHGSGVTPSESLDLHAILPRQSPMGGIEYTQPSNLYADPDRLSPHLTRQKNNQSLINSVVSSGYLRDYSSSKRNSLETNSSISTSLYSPTNMAQSHSDTITELKELRNSIEKSNQHQRRLESQLTILQATLDATLQRSLSASRRGTDSDMYKQSFNRSMNDTAFGGNLTPLTHSLPPVNHYPTQYQTAHDYNSYTKQCIEYTPDIATDYPDPMESQPLDNYSFASLNSNADNFTLSRPQPVRNEPYSPVPVNFYMPKSYVETQQLDDSILDSDGTTALMLAVRTGDSIMLREKLHLARKTNKLGKTALMIAAECNNLDAINILVTYEAKVRAFGDNDYTALMYAAQRGYADCVRTLAQYEARLHSAMGYTALMLAAQNNNVECVLILKPYEAGMQTPSGLTALICAASNSNEECVKLLVDREATMVTTHLSQQGAGFTALMAAARTGSYTCTKILLPYEAHLAQENGKMAQDWANESWYSNSRTRELIYEYGVSRDRGM